MIILHQKCLHENSSCHMENLKEISRLNSPKEPKMSKENNKQNPSDEKFSFIPKAFKQLTPFFTSVRWDSANKQLSVGVVETPDFDVIRWLEYIDKQDHDCQKSPFADAGESNSCLLIFKDNSGKGLAQVRFYNIKSLSHKCEVYAVEARFGDDRDKANLNHYVTLKYENSKFEELIDEDEIITSCDDKEWKKK